MLLARVVAGLIVVLSTAAGHTAALPRMLVETEAEREMSSDLVNLLTDLLLAELQAANRYDVIGGNDIDAMLSAEEQRRLAGCSDEGCLSQIVGALGAEYIAKMGLGTVGEYYLLNIKIIEVATAKVIARVSQQLDRDENELPSGIGRAVLRLLSQNKNQGRQRRLLDGIENKGLQECRTVAVIPFFNRRSMKTRSFPIPKGGVVNRIERDDRWTDVEAGGRKGFVETSFFERRCEVWLEPEAPQANEVVAPKNDEAPAASQPEVMAAVSSADDTGERRAKTGTEAFDAGTLRIVVGEVTPQGELAAELPEMIAGALADGLASVGAFDVISRLEVQQVLRIGQDRQLLGCDRPDCYTELAGLLAAERLATGTVSKNGKEYSLSLALVDLNTGSVENRVSTKVAGARGKLLGQVRRQAKFLVAKALAARSGELHLVVDQQGANLEVDGKLIGVTPVGLLSLPGGSHTLRVAKEGFVDWSRDIAIAHAETTDLRAVLVPSAAFAEAYERMATVYRGLGWGTLGLAAAGGITAIILKTQADASADTLRNDVGLVLAGTSSPGLSTASDFDARKEGIDAFDTAALSVAIISAISAAASAYFFLDGDEPGRYAAFEAPHTPAAAYSSARRPAQRARGGPAFHDKIRPAPEEPVVAPEPATAPEEPVAAPEPPTPPRKAPFSEAGRRQLRRKMFKALAKKKWSEAVEHGQRLREEFRLDWEAEYMLAFAIEHTGRLEEALTHFRTFIERYPDNASVDGALLQAAGILLQQNRNEQARPMLERAAKSNSKKTARKAKALLKKL